MCCKTAKNLHYLSNSIYNLVSHPETNGNQAWRIYCPSELSPHGNETRCHRHRIVRVFLNGFGFWCQFLHIWCYEKMPSSHFAQRYFFVGWGADQYPLESTLSVLGHNIPRIKRRTKWLTATYFCFIGCDTMVYYIELFLRLQMKTLYMSFKVWNLGGIKQQKHGISSKKPIAKKII